MIQSYVEAYPWDLTPVDADPLLGRLRGEVGITGLSVWAGARPTIALRLRGWQPAVFRSCGGLYFQASRERYEHTRCRPLASRWTHEGERFERVVAACLRHGLTLRFLVSAAATGRLAEHYPEFAARNLLGVESTTALCLINPDVQDYLISLVAELSERFSPASIVLSDYAVGWFEAFETDFDAGTFGPALRSLCGMCFCSSCQQQAEEAGVDALGAQETGLSLVQQGKDAATGDSLWAAYPSLAEFRRLQNERLNGLLNSLVQACRCELLLSRAVGEAHTDPTGAVNPATPAGVLTRLGHLSQLDQGFVPKAKRNELCLPVSQALDERGPEFVASIHRSVTMGYGGVQLQHFGILADSVFPTIKQAVRFARRSAD